ncbi:undecaprenyl-diphosphatase BcrC [Alicyclobacillus contaminans]|uniref:undecaprenyl-diphosphatase n=1 Tax=Alicyclobacillus contaminans TaxID=392016 RepID=UPI0004282E1C|nr:undecaprenyl-diphosphatase [Alicyclobacillus contaminans]GMA50400.1 undecaprenyl-diphosphatase BcrC [Alicyclobacillus contaminans]
MNPFDVTVYHDINQFAGHHPVLDAFMAFIAKDALELYALLFIVAWFAMPKAEERKRHALVVSFCSGVLALVINVVISHIWFRPRPFVALPKGSFTQLIPHPADASFPSDHTSGSFAFASGVAGSQLRWVQYSFTILAVLTMIARVYVGVHWPTDVLAGLVVGLVAGRVMRKYERLVRPLTRVALRIFHYGPYSRGAVHAKSSVAR